MEQKYWKIIDFATEVGKHYNTVDSWFKKLEEKGIHAIQRNEFDEKVYDELDYRIAVFIQEKRDQKWSLDAVFRELENHFELRRPVTTSGSRNDSQMIDFISLRQEFQKAIEEMAAQYQERIIQLEEKITVLEAQPKLRDPTEQRQQRIDGWIMVRRIESQLEKEALNLWVQKPESERMKKVGWFRKEEDRDGRDRFVKEYIHQHLEDRLQKELQS